MNNQSKFHPIRDFTILASLISAFLYAVGYLYETVYLESFGLNTSELAPDIPTSISFGFRYIFLNTTSGIVIASIIVFFALLVVDQIKQDFLAWLAASDKITRVLRSISQSVNFSRLKIYVLIASPFLLFMVLFHSINKGSELAESLKKEEETDRIIVIKSGHEMELEGKVVRLRDGVVAFWEKTRDVTHIFNLETTFRITYGKESPNESSKKEADKARASS
ncbi:hypothetical protein DFO83_102124 [Idiomarina loihiensis]|uniref:hypothetical protein n=1 Tax=Idiomarina TaxID=135575 RepID=UPI000D71307E|nr:hypothetical protein [Idiomarina]PWW40306.1 hypothetical protein DFO83_102124 [Idiomarina loihiensis]TDP49997.1 hypothetical protein DET58_102120 [Idiomarina loihiensis]TDS24651.1 hypothetical protein DET62_102260 [Idiomarina sp. H2]